MEYESAVEFKKVTVKTIDVETGEEKVEDLGGYNLLLKCISNIKEQMEMFFCLLKSMGFGDDHIEKLREETLSSLNSQDFDKKVKKKPNQQRRKRHLKLG